MPIGKKKQPKIPKGYEGGDVVYEVTTKQTFYPKFKPSKASKKVRDYGRCAGRFFRY